MLNPLRTRFSLGLLLLGALVVAEPGSVSAQTGLFNGPVDVLPVQERTALREGRPIVTGEQGSYTARILINATPARVWAVLTDYPSYTRFLPNVASSRVLQSNGNQRIVEQVDRRRVALITVTSRTRLAITETPQSGLRFELVEGDNIQKMQGGWTLQPVAAYPGGPTNQVLMTYQIQAEPKSGTPRSLFYNLFRAQVEASLTAIRAEVGRRA